MDVLESCWDLERKLICCVRVAQWQAAASAASALVERKRKSLV